MWTVCFSLVPIETSSHISNVIKWMQIFLYISRIDPIPALEKDVENSLDSASATILEIRCHFYHIWSFKSEQADKAKMTLTSFPQIRKLNQKYVIKIVTSRTTLKILPVVARVMPPQPPPPKDIHILLIKTSG